MPFPNTEGKHGYDPLFTASEAIAYRRRSGRWQDFPAPDGVIICYQRTLLHQFLATEDVERVEMVFGHLYLLKRTQGRVGVRAGFGIGSPVAAMALEDLIALGTRQYLNIGVAGGIQPALRIGDVTLCTGAVRDEGVSHHYLPPARYVEPSPALTARLRTALTRRSAPLVEGPTWTIDAPFRETVEELRQYRAEGVLTVEMEAAALFAVAQVRKVEIASAFVISDLLGETWEPQFDAAEVAQNLIALYELAVELFVRNG
ncbi:MAG: purine phosphorylase [Chloroflexi bacterium]|nr:MAG: purine phosphorylase [Chloroflexota bacterium]